MDNSETQHWIHKTQDEEKNTTQKIKKTNNLDPPKTEGEPRCSQMVSSSCLLYDTRYVTHIIKTCWTPLYTKKHK